ncbi:hypothetical protein [Alkaliphilus sp. B6464]|uniref:hypothetical protein n=1 Tax=Alkaliphilus sp. B6464 TaxID=2731219 RepID=UPI001BA6432A|nr:hypothetical protein [Alkaliphilus sp. B6464]QUH22054.1 hypothetical protein HYG84_19300 [Alkaliphilus sp. B6464]
MNWLENFKKQLTENKLSNLKVTKNDGEVKSVDFEFSNGEKIELEIGNKINKNKTIEK